MKSNVANQIFLYLNKPIKNKEMFVRRFVEKIPYFEDVGYAGYIGEDELKRFLLWSIYGQQSETSWEEINQQEIKSVIKDTLEICRPVINHSIRIFVFPTVNKFTKQKMGGVAGFTPWKNTIIINLYQTENIKQRLKETLGHELAHALALNFNERSTLQDDLVFEGVAEHFRECFIGGGKAEWVNSISKEKAKTILLGIKQELSNRNDILYKELFFGSNRYPLWSGYAVGYYLVESYLEKLNKKDWKEIIKTQPSKIMKRNSFLDQ